MKKLNENCPCKRIFCKRHEGRNAYEEYLGELLGTTQQHVSACSKKTRKINIFLKSDFKKKKMSGSKEYLDFILEQFNGLDRISYKY